jgi:hypothetical protein
MFVCVCLSRFLSPDPSSSTHNRAFCSVRTQVHFFFFFLLGNGPPEFSGSVLWSSGYRSSVWFGVLFFCSSQGLFFETIQCSTFDRHCQILVLGYLQCSLSNLRPFLFRRKGKFEFFFHSLLILRFSLSFSPRKGIQLASLVSSSLRFFPILMSLHQFCFSSL